MKIIVKQFAVEMFVLPPSKAVRESHNAVLSACVMIAG